MLGDVDRRTYTPGTNGILSNLSGAFMVGLLSCDCTIIRFLVPQMASPEGGILNVTRQELDEAVRLQHSDP